MKHKDKVIIVTGAARGIGFAIAKRFLEEGGKLALCDISEESVNKAVSELSVFGKVVGFITDISDFAQCQTLVEKTVNTYGKVDILINNAGITKDAQFYKMDLENFRQVLDVNLMGTVNMTKAVVPFFMEQRSGRIISAASTACIGGNFGQTNYAASKAAIMSFTKSLARELGKYGINVTAVAPGLTRTEMVAAMPTDVLAKRTERVALRRPGEPSEIAAVYSFLASEDASYISGQTIIVDGGYI